MAQIIWILEISEFLVHITKVLRVVQWSDFGQTLEFFDEKHQINLVDNLRIREAAFEAAEAASVAQWRLLRPRSGS